MCCRLTLQITIWYFPFFFRECAPSTTFHLTILDSTEHYVPHAFADTGFGCSSVKDEVYSCALCPAGSFNRNLWCINCSAGNWRKITGWINHPSLLDLSTFLYMGALFLSQCRDFSPSPRNQYWSQLSGEGAGEVELFLAVAMRSIYDIGWKCCSHMEIVRSRFWRRRTGNRWGQVRSDCNSTHTLSEG